MRIIWTIAAKELLSTFSDRTLLIIMIATPLLLSTIIALAFGGGGNPDAPAISSIPIAVVNLDQGLGGADELDDDALPALNAGALIAAILASSPAQGRIATLADLPPCTMDEQPASAGAQSAISLDDLFTATVLSDASNARLGVEQGEYVAAVVIPAGFTRALLPSGGDEIGKMSSPVEVYANAGSQLEAQIVATVVGSVVDRFHRMRIALLGMGQTVSVAIADTATADLASLSTSLPDEDAAASEWQAFLSASARVSPWLATLDRAVTRLANGDGEVQAEVGSALGCLLAVDSGPVQLIHQPLSPLQEQSFFAQIMVQVGSAQAVFFALFTGTFGLLGIYQERRQWTLQRMLAAPIQRTSILGGFLGGNVLVVWAQLALLMFFLTLISTVIMRQPILIWGTQWLMLVLLTVSISLCVSGLGVLVVGVARTPEQVQVFAPVINIFLGALGGAFGFRLPDALASLSLITWATDAYRTLAAGQSDIGLNLLVLLGQSLLFFTVGLWFFRRRVSL